MDRAVETTFTIQGMSCSGCVASVTRVLNAIPGVEPLQVDIGSARVRIDPAIASPAAVGAALTKAGYEAVAQE
jgi:copper chaperone CopZ